MNRNDYERLKAKVSTAREAIVEARDDAEALLGTIRDEAGTFDEEMAVYYLTTTYEQLVSALIKLNIAYHDVNALGQK